MSKDEQTVSLTQKWARGKAPDNHKNWERNVPRDQDVELHLKPNGWYYLVFFVKKYYKKDDETFEKRVKSHEKLYDNSCTLQKDGLLPDQTQPSKEAEVAEQAVKAKTKVSKK